MGTVTIPASVKRIGDYAFQGDSHVTNFVFEGDAPQVGLDAFDGVGSSFLNLQNGELPTATVHIGTYGWGQEGEIWNGLRITYAQSPTSYTITWLDDDGTVLGTDTLASGSTPSRQGPTKAAVPPYSYAFAAWTPTIVPVAGDASYTATYTRIADLSTLTGDWTATNGDVLTNATTHAITVPGGATVTINGVTVTGGGGADNSPATFAEGGEAFTSAFTPGANGTWRLTAFAELASGSAAGLADSQIKVRRADTVAGLATAESTTSGVTVLEKVPAVKVDLEVTVPPNTDNQFFRVEFGE